jgi:5,10-methylenetetrahydromethanopterin reductase
LDRYLRRLQLYLSGGVVEDDGPLAQLTWVNELSVPKVPVDVAASGPRVIALGALMAERLTVNVGADAYRVGRALEVAREARRAAGLSPEGVSFGAYVNVAPHPDRRIARELVKPVSAVYARFSADSADQVDSRDAAIMRAVADDYDMARHGRVGARHLSYLTDDFLDRFAVAGTPQDCVERLSALEALGLDRFIVVGPMGDAAPEDISESWRLLADVVLPEVRRASSR